MLSSLNRNRSIGELASLTNIKNNTACDAMPYEVTMIRPDTIRRQAAAAAVYATAAIYTRGSRANTRSSTIPILCVYIYMCKVRMYVYKVRTFIQYLYI